MSNSIIKSPIDHRNYKHCILDNGIQVLGISDKKSSLSHVTLTVAVGSFDDGEIEGISHALEHMIFLGTRKYPDENYFFDYISKNGGQTNAYTDNDHTSYYFSVETMALEKAIDIFSNFFIDPLFDEKLIKNELKSVDSEHKKNIVSDDWRSLQLLKTISNKNTPFCKFTGGSKKTLDIPDIHKKIKKFYEDKYSSNNMKIVISSDCSIDFLCNITNVFFGKIKKKIVYIPRYFSSPLNTPKYLQVVPVNLYRKLQICWHLPFDLNHINIKPTTYISHILNYQSEQTLIHYLKKHGFISNFICGNLEKIGNNTIFMIEFDMTIKGENNVSVIFNSVNDYIDLIKKTFRDNVRKMKQIYNELKTSSWQSFVYDNRDDDNFTNNIAKLWSKYNIPVKQLLMSEYHFMNFDENVKHIIEDYLNYFNNENVVVIHSSPKFKGKTSKIEKWYGGHYNEYQNLSKIQKNTIKTKLLLPRKNKFICNNIQTINNFDKSNEYPTEIYNSDGLRIFHYFDDINKLIPKTVLYVYIKFPKVLDNIINYLIFKIYFAHIKLKLNDLLYEAEVAGYNTEITSHRNNIIIKIFGFNTYFSKVVEIIVNRIIDNTINRENFNKIKERLCLELEDWNNRDNLDVMSDVINFGMDDKTFPVQKQLQDIKKITKKNYDYLIDKVMEKSTIVCYLHGNILNYEALSVGIKFKKIIKEFYEINIKNLVITNNNTNNFINIKRNHNIVPLVIYCCNIDHIRPGFTEDWSLKISCIKLLDICINNKFYHELRTKQQLGYIVHAMSNKIGDIMIPYYQFNFIVQSDNDSNKVIDSIKNFLADFYVKLRNMSKNEFNNYKISLINKLHEKEFVMDIMANNKFYNIISTDQVFNEKEVIIATLNNLNLDDFVNFYRKFIYGSTNNNSSVFLLTKN
ncbi:Zn-dependent peptidase [Catovirus CTV1]|uniref:Zn-dependent peptidase n=1 Tax=Catovirus CTV1 TaxID=1977631 RepID=A0A1V0SBX2_9VIRU|nr:Zn-dependent peptidase [Catovirus CTV1]